MNTEAILRQLEAERDRLNQAIKALQGARGRGRPRIGTRRLSAAARRRISEAQKKRWGARKKA
jgi:hypothetical protein